GQRKAAAEHDRVLAQGRKDPVAILEREGGGDGRRLLARDRAVEADFALALLAEHALVEATDAQELSVHREEGRVGEKRIGRSVRRSVVTDHAAEPERGVLAQVRHEARASYPPHLEGQSGRTRSLMALDAELVREVPCPNRAQPNAGGTRVGEEEESSVTKTEVVEVEPLDVALDERDLIEIA